MKKQRPFPTAIALVSALAIAAIVLTQVPGLLSRAEPTATMVAISPNTATPTGTPGPCVAENLRANVIALDAFAREFNDFWVIAENTVRGSLAPMITELQRVRRDAELFSVPGCLEKMKALQLAYMNKFIDTLVALYSTSTVPDSALTEEDVQLINNGMATALDLRAQYVQVGNLLLGVPTETPTAGTLTPEGPSQPTKTPTAE